MTLLFVLLSTLAMVANTIPAWGLEARQLAGAQYADPVNAVFPARNWDKSKVLMSANGADKTGHALADLHPEPPLFFISPPRGGKLYQMVNDTTILHVNVHNMTEKVDGDQVPLPFRVSIGEGPEGLEDSEWKWGGSQLYFHHGVKTNYGIFYHCIGEWGRPSLWLDLDIVKAPGHCELTTLHQLKKGP